MMMNTEQDQIVEVGPAPGFPRDYVVHVGEGPVGTAGETAMAIAPDDLSSLGLCWEAFGPTLVHGVADVVVDPDGDGGVTGDPLHRVAIDQSVMLELSRRAP